MHIYDVDATVFVWVKRLTFMIISLLSRITFLSADNVKMSQTLPEAYKAVIKSAQFAPRNYTRDRS